MSLRAVFFFFFFNDCVPCLQSFRFYKAKFEKVYCNDEYFSMFN